MQIVIDIPEEIYENFQNAKRIGESKYKDYLVGIYFGIKKGIVLPKGHGRLIDADALEKDADYSNYDGYYHAYSSNAIYHAPTIIEAEVTE